jgi:hypothetical protein
LHRLGILETDSHYSGFWHPVIQLDYELCNHIYLRCFFNGEATNFFKSGRGLRQGCPLSPLLFILAMEGLNLLIKNNITEGTITGIKVSKLIKVVHLLFVDDIIIMTKENINEWRVISNILQSFCNGHGLNDQQYKNYCSLRGINRLGFEPLKEILPYTFIELTTGFKYLGYYLKTGPSRKEDWIWLVTKMERKIGLWCNKWLSLGGRFVLVKAVLESQSVYWMSMELIPRSILNKIRKMMFDFLWSGSKSNHQFHLCRWDMLSRPKKCGGGASRISLFLIRLYWSILYGEFLLRMGSGIEY